ncbi:MAG: response regulator, partial [Marinoscillum sp.]
FKRFYRIESEEAFKISGSGIGLALTEELIKTHHGEIFVDSKLGEGSTFEVQFPCLKGAYTSDEVNGKDSEALNIHDQVAILKNEFLIPESTEDSTESEMSQLDQTRSTLLVVEDNNDLRRFMVHRLRKNYNVIEAPDGLQGIAMAEKESPDAIISDVMMPNVDGLELCGTLKNNLSTSHIPIILLTAKSAIENQIEGLQIGADDYLAKPFNFELLEARVQNLIESRAKLRQLFQDTEEVSPNEVTTNIKDQKFLEHAIQTVEENLTDSDFGARQFVESMGISRSLLHKKLTSITNQSAAEFINHLRMKKAKELLRQNELNVSEVAYAVGYNDPKYFTRLFSKLNDQSPKEFANSFLVRG